MKAFIYLAILTLATGQEIEYANRKWLQVNRTLYQINVEPETKWKEALIKCGKEKLQLLKPSADSNHVELQNFIKTKFKQFPSFWVQNNVSAGTLMQKIGFKKGGKGKACNKLDRKTFQIKAEECHQPLGYICQTTLVSGNLEYKVQDTNFYIYPEPRHSCVEAKSVCALRNMTIVFLDSFQRNKLLNDYLFLNYGSQPSFWFSTIEGNIATGCFPWSRTSRVAKGSQHGVICEITVLKSGLTFRHLVLIASVSVMLVLSLSVYGVLKCFFIRKRAELHQKFHNEKE